MSLYLTVKSLLKSGVSKATIRKIYKANWKHPEQTRQALWLEYYYILK